MDLPSELKATEKTQSSCPRKGVPIGLPEIASNSRKVPSSIPATILRPSGENAVESTLLSRFARSPDLGRSLAGGADPLDGVFG